jgi:hypothetical protein
MSETFRFEAEPLENRGRVVRMALVYTPVAVVSLALVILAIVNIVSGETGFIVMLVFFGLLAFLTGFQAIQYLKDLGAQPVEYQGEVVKKWTKGNLFIFFLPSFYVAIDSRSLRGRVTRVEDKGAYVRMENGDECFVPRKELAMEVKPSAQEMVRPGEEIQYKVISIDGNGAYKISCRRAEERTPVTKLFTVNRLEYAMLLELDLVKVICYPNSATIERIERYDDYEKKFIPATSGATL